MNSLTGRRVTTVLTIVGVLGAVGCSSSSSSASKSSLAAVSSPTSSAAPAVTGTPVKVGIIFDDNNPVASTPEIRIAALAAQDLINKERGGFAGHPVQVVACSASNDPAKAQGCAQQFVQAGVVAVGGLGGVWSDNGVPVIEKAGILNVTQPIGANEFSNPVSYPFVGGSITATAVLAKYFTTKHVTKASAIYVDLPAAKAFAQQFWCGSLQKQGVGQCSIVPVKGDAPDVTPAVTQAVNGNPDVVLMVHGAAGCERILKSAVDAGLIGKSTWATSSSCADPKQVLAPLGQNANGLVVAADLSSYADTSDPDVTVFRNALQKYGNGQEPTPTAALSFSSVMTLKSVADRLGPDHLASSDFLGFMKTVSGLKVFMGSTLDASKTIPNLPQMRAVEAEVQVIKNGVPVDASGGFINPFAA